MDIESYRHLFPITERYAYLNNAACAPTCRPVADAIGRYLEETQHEPFDLLMERYLEGEAVTRERAAQLMNAARADEIVQVPGTATGINIAARSLPLRAGDNVLLLDGDYPAVIYPWLNLAPEGILTKIVPQRDGGLDLDLLESRLDSHTRVVCLSTAMFATGFRNDMAAVGALCRERGIYFVVDAIQTLGVLPVDVQAWNVDILAAGSQKWLLCPPGGGLLYCRHDLLDELRLGAYVGALSVVSGMDSHEYNFTLHPSSARFLTSAGNFPAFAAMHAALGLILEIGIDRIARHVLGLTDLLCRDLEERGYRFLSDRAPEHRSSIVVVDVPDPADACRRLHDAGVVAAVRGHGLRISPHFFNNREDVCRVGEVLSEPPVHSP